MQNIKILCVIDSLCSGGAQRQMVELAIGFKERGNIVSLLTYHDIPFYKSKLLMAGIQIECISEANYVRRLFKIRSYIRHGNFDTVLSFLEAPNIICEFAGFPYRRWKLVVGERSANPKIVNSIKLRFLRFWHFLSDYIVSNSYENMKLVLSANPLLRKSKCRVLYNVVDPNIWKPVNKKDSQKNGIIKLVIAANQSYPKNLIGLVKALELLDRGDLDRLKIDWYGDRLTMPYIDNSFIEAKERIMVSGLEGIISFHPATQDIVSIIQDSDALGLFSFFKVFPNAICEGMSCAKPVICTTVSDIPRLLSHDHRLLCEPENPQSIKSSLSYLINLSSIQLAQIGRKNSIVAKEWFNREDIISDYLELFLTKRRITPL